MLTTPNFTPLLLRIGPHLCKRWEELPVPIQTLLQSELPSYADWDRFSPDERANLCWQQDQQRDPAREPVLQAALCRKLVTIEGLKDEARRARNPLAESQIQQVKDLIEELLWRCRTDAGEELRKFIADTAAANQTSSEDTSSGKKIDPRWYRSIQVLLGAIAKVAYGKDISAQRIPALQEITSDLERLGVNLTPSTVSQHLKSALATLEHATSSTSKKTG